MNMPYLYELTLTKSKRLVLKKKIPHRNGSVLIQVEEHQLQEDEVHARRKHAWRI